MSESKTELEAIIVGAGVSGIATGCRLQLDLGLKNFKIFDRDTTWGGTWLQNQYPGCGCDVPTRLYSLSFAQRANWKQFFSLQDEIHEYLQDVAEEFHLPRKAHFEHEVISATFDDVNAHWIVKVRDLKTKEEKTHTARLFFSCVGALSVPRKCDVPGSESFQGSLFHSARWEKDVDLQDRKVVILGNGCTASQIVPAISPKVKQLTQIVRSKHWYVPHFGTPFENGFWKFVQRHSQAWCSFERFCVIVLCESHLLQAFKKDGKAARERVAARSTAYIKRCAPAKYHDLLIPKPGELEVACKRRIFDSTYIPSLGRENVELTGDQAAEIVKDGVILKSGRKIEADVIILANGFQTDQFALQMEIKNAQGKTLEDYWKKETGVPQAYRTFMSSPFPNMFIIWGPNAVTGHFSAIWGQERAIEMAMKIVRPLFLTGNKSLTPIQRSHGKTVRVHRSAEDYEQVFIQAQMQEMIYTTGCGSWYVDQYTGKVTAVNPSFQTTIAFRSKFPYFSDYDYRGVSSNAAWGTWPLTQKIGSLLRLGATPDVSQRQYNIFFKLFLTPLWILRYIIRRSAVRSLQGLSWFIDLVFPYNKPKPYSLSNSDVKSQAKKLGYRV